jgi:hypothetical protein
MAVVLMGWVQAYEELALSIAAMPIIVVGVGLAANRVRSESEAQCEQSFNGAVLVGSHLAWFPVHRL